MATSASGWEISLIDSVWHGSAHEGSDGLALAAQVGYDAVDLFVGFDPAALSSHERDRYVADVRNCGIPPLSVICTCLGLNDFNPSVRDYHIRRACAAIDLGAEFDSVRNLLFVPGEYMFQGRLLPRDQEWEKVVDATRRVGAHAAQFGLEVAIELLPFEHAFIRSLEDLERLLDEVDLRNVKAAIDISHLWLERIKPHELERFQGRIAQVHIADCDGEHHGDLPPGRGNTPFGDYLSALAAAGYRGSASVELEFPARPEETVSWVVEALASTRELLVESGLREDLGSSSV
jgi:sugar phosphate isomerase/epimerase